MPKARPPGILARRAFSCLGAGAISAPFAEKPLDRQCKRGKHVGMDIRTRITTNAASASAAVDEAQSAASVATAGRADTQPPFPPARVGDGEAFGAANVAGAARHQLVDPFGRTITYLRISVTDRCDFRCRYCMVEHPDFLPKKEILSLEEIDLIASTFVRMGVRKLRLTGGEPLVRRNVMWLIRRLGRHLQAGMLDELTLTTNGSQLVRFADELADAGVRRINVSLDTLDAHKFRTITRRGDLGRVLEGLTAARRAGLRVKINTVALKGVNEDELPSLVEWAHGQGFDITFIETMPMGEMEYDRAEYYLPLDRVRSRLQQRWTLEPEAGFSTGGPSRYMRVRETGGRVGFITPLSAHFCDDCNRVRLTATGKLYMCLGQNEDADLKAVLRREIVGADDETRMAALEQAIRAAVARKPRGHDFAIAPGEVRGQMPRHMNVTGG